KDYHCGSRAVANVEEGKVLAVGEEGQQLGAIPWAAARGDVDQIEKLQVVDHPQDVILIGIILRVIDNLKLFDLVYITTRGGPGDRTELLTFFAYRQNFAFFNVGYGSAAAVVILLISIIVTTIAVTFLRRMQNA
ncbi:MAG: hypothetical protein AAFU41_19330, partial [Pseudomonadota bacterium]